MELLKIWVILLRRRWIILWSFVFFVGAVLLFTLLVPSAYKSTVKILVKPANAENDILTGLQLQTISSTAYTEYDTEIGLALSKPLAAELIKKFDLKDRFGGEMREEKFVKSSFLNLLWPQPSVSVEQYEDSTMLEITAISYDKQQAADMAELLANLYIEKRQEILRKEYTDSKETVLKQIESVRQHYYQQLDNLFDFMVNDGVLDLDAEVQQLLAKIAALISDQETTLENIQTYEREIKETREYLAKTDSFREDSKDISENQIFKDLKGQLNIALVNLASKKVDYLPSHPEYQEVDNQIKEIEELLRHEVELSLSRKISVLILFMINCANNILTIISILLWQN